jgi:hypothetical protein
MESWVGRSYREAAAMVAALNTPLPFGKYDALVSLLAAAYRTGALDGMQRAQEIMCVQAAHVVETVLHVLDRESFRVGGDIA